MYVNVGIVTRNYWRCSEYVYLHCKCEKVEYMPGFNHIKVRYRWTHAVCLTNFSLNQPLCPKRLAMFPLSGDFRSRARQQWNRSSVTDVHFRCLLGPVFDPPWRETAGRVTRWPCLWRNWKIDNLGVSNVPGSETCLQFSYLFGSKLHQAFPYPPKWLSK